MESVRASVSDAVGCGRRKRFETQQSFFICFFYYYYYFCLFYYYFFFLARKQTTNRLIWLSCATLPSDVGVLWPQMLGASCYFFSFVKHPASRLLKGKGAVLICEKLHTGKGAGRLCLSRSCIGDACGWRGFDFRISRLLCPFARWNQYDAAGARVAAL